MTMRGGITRASNPRVRHKLIEGTWTYRLQARPVRESSTSSGRNRQKFRTLR